MGDRATVCIGVVAPLTGRLAPLGEPLSFVLRHLAPHLKEIRNAGRTFRVRVAVRDSRSEARAARQAVEELARDERAAIVLTMAGTEVLPAVTDACEQAGVPCVSTTFPWQAYGVARSGDAEASFDFTYHFAWGLDDIAHVFADLWEQLPGQPTVGCLWNDGLQGRLLRDERIGFAPAAARRGHQVIDPGAYPEPASDFTAHLNRMRQDRADVVTSAATATDLALFHLQAREAGIRPRLVTCSRWLTYPHTEVAQSQQVHDELAGSRVGTLVYWTPHHPYRSSLDGSSCTQLAQAYEQVTGKPWLQPLGLAHALVEVAHHALATAPDPTDRPAIANTLGKSRINTIVGTLDWSAGPTPNIALIPLAGGQWHPQPHGPRLEVVTNSRTPNVPVTADLVPAY
ncbi:ABC transporter substrate-binding protein [Streptomyces sp. NPDC058335]|uniref:ABC transporter substrate-binding protein n=1 Tax=Streptomyces sp. NPDC058335 TaxID=3346451 RepID=UPI003654C197